jgi:hypothetical protein
MPMTDLSRLETKLEYDGTGAIKSLDVRECEMAAYLSLELTATAASNGQLQMN